MRKQIRRTKLVSSKEVGSQEVMQIEGVTKFEVRELSLVLRNL